MIDPSEATAWLQCDQDATVVQATAGVDDPEALLAAVHASARRRRDVARLLRERRGEAPIGMGRGEERRTHELRAEPGPCGSVIFGVRTGDAVPMPPPGLESWARACLDGVAVTDRDGYLLYANPAFSALAGRGAGTLDRLLDDGTRHAIEASLDDDGAWSGDAHLWSEGRGAVPVHVSVSRDEQGRLILLVRDLKRAQMHARARASSTSVDLLTRLAAGLAHDVNNLAAQIVGWSRRALASGDGSVRAEALSEQASLGRDLGAVGWQLLGLTHTETLVTTADLAKVAREVGWLLERLSNRVRRVEVVAPPVTRSGSSDADRLQVGVPHPIAVGVGLQLAIHALESSAPDSPITICVRADGETQAGLSVAYEPVASELEELRSLAPHEVVWRLVDPDVARRLEAAELVVEATERPGRLELSLSGRRRHERVRPSRTAVPAAAAHHLRRVLVVDDNEPLRELMVAILSDTAEHVVEAEDGVAALERLQEMGGRVDLVISDVMMPRKNGVELCLAIQERYPDIAVFLTSGVSLSPTAQARVPGVPFLRKPFELDDLLAMVQAAQPARPAA